MLTIWTKNQQNGSATNEAPTNVPGQVEPQTEVANEATNAGAAESAKQAGKPRAPRPQKQRGPPEDGIPSKTKVMVANLPYDLTEDKVRISLESTRARLLTLFSSSRKSLPITNLFPPRSPCVPFLVS